MSLTIPLEIIHQQQGGLSLNEFAARENISIQSLQRYVNKGLVLGAQKDSRSKRWIIYPPAKLMRSEIGSYTLRKRPLPYDDPRVKEAQHVLFLLNAKQPYSVSFTGAHILSVERLLARECELLKRQRLDDDEFEQDSRAGYGDKLRCCNASVFHAVGENQNQECLTLQLFLLYRWHPAVAIRDLPMMPAPWRLPFMKSSSRPLCMNDSIMHNCKALIYTCKV